MFKFYNNARISTKYRIAFLSTIAFFLIAAAISGYLFLNVRKNIDIIRNESEVQQIVSNMNAVFSAKDMKVADFLLTDWVQFKTDFDELSAQFDALVEELTPFLNTAKEKELLNEIMENNRLHNEIFETVIFQASQDGNLNEIQKARSETREISDKTAKLLTELEKMATENSKRAYENTVGSAFSANIIIVASFVIVAVVGSALMEFISRGIQKNLKEVVFVSNEIANGNLQVDDLKDDGRKDEIGQLSQSINTMKQNLNAIIAQITYISNHLANKSKEIFENADELQAGSQQIASTMEELSSGAEEQANSANHLFEQMSDFFQIIADSVYQTETVRKLAGDMDSMAEKGSQYMDESVQNMNVINDKINHSLGLLKGLDMKINNINQLIIVIKEIADQTNLLALNASIEAARAGEYGRGFAVVADEVRNLAEQVNSSVSNISSILHDINDSSKNVLQSLEEGYELVEQGTDQIHVTGETFTKIMELIDIVGEQLGKAMDSLYKVIDDSKSFGTSIETISSVSQESASAVEETTHTIQEASESMEKIAQNTQQMKDEADKLQEVVQHFKI